MMGMLGLFFFMVGYARVRNELGPLARRFEVRLEGGNTELLRSAPMSGRRRSALPAGIV